MSIDTLENKADLERFVRNLLQQPNILPKEASNGLNGQLKTMQDAIDALTALSGIPGATFDAKGDLLVGSADNAYDNLARGSNGNFLKADSAQTLGLVWVALAMSDVSGLVAALAAKQDISGLAALAFLGAGAGLESSGGNLRIASSAAGTGLTGGGGSALSVSFGSSAGTVTEGDDSRLPTSSEHDALGGTDGSPSINNRYVTDSDPIRRPTQLLLPEAILALQPSLYWSLGASGGLTDQGTGGNNGTGQGSVTIGGAGALTSDGGASTDFDGTDDYITSSYAAFASSSVRTFTGWCSADDFAGFLIAGSGASTPPGLAFAVGGYLGFDVRQGGGTVLSRSPATTTNTVMWAVVWNDSTSTARLYVNGTFIASGQISPNGTYSSPGNFQVAARGTGISSFNGKQAHIAVYEKELSLESISWLFRIGKGAVKEWGLVNALPTDALIGDTCQFIADSTNGVVWNLIFDGNGTYPWKYIGGSSLSTEAITSRTTSSTTYTALATDPLSITLPAVTGDFAILIGGRLNGSTTNSALLSYDVGTTGASDNWSVRAASGAQDASTFEHVHTGVASGAMIAEKAKVGGGATTGSFADRQLRVRPIRVG